MSLPLRVQHRSLLGLLAAAAMVTRAEDRDVGRAMLDDVRIPTDTPADNVFLPGRRAKAQRARVRRDDRDVLRAIAADKRKWKGQKRLEHARRQAEGEWNARFALAQRNYWQVTVPASFVGKPW